jgi:hypothetical protein
MCSLLQGLAAAEFDEDELDANLGIATSDAIVVHVPSPLSGLDPKI